MTNIRKGILGGFLFAVLIPLLPAYAQDCYVGMLEYLTADLKKDKKVKAYTVSSGTKIRTFDLWYIDWTKHPQLSSENILLFHARNSSSPIVGGMSGTPVCADGKVIGVLGYGYGFDPNNRPIAGITRAGAVYSQREALGERGLTTRGSLLGSGQPIDTRPAFQGVGDDISAELEVLGLGSFGIFAPASISVASGSDQMVGSTKPKAGESITLMIVDGDLRIGAMCTLSGETAGGRLTICGHPIFADGDIAIPAYRNAIAGSTRSSKIPQRILDYVGLAVYDGPFGVEIVPDSSADVMMPITLDVNLDSSNFHYEYDVVRHKSLTTRMVILGLERFTRNIWSGNNALATARLSATIHIKGRDSIQVYSAGLVRGKDFMSSGRLVSTDPWQDIFYNFRSHFFLLDRNDVALEIERVVIKLDIWRGMNILGRDATIIEVNGELSDEIRLGDTITVSLALRDQGSPNTPRRRVKSISFVIPDSLNLVLPDSPDVKYLHAELVISDGTNYVERDVLKRDSIQDVDLGERLLSFARMGVRNPSEIFVQLVLPMEKIEGIGCAQSLPAFTSNWTTSRDRTSLRGCGRTSAARVLSFSLGVPSEEAIVTINEVVDLKFKLD